MFAWLGGNEYGQQGMKFLTGAKILQELYRRFTQTDQIIEALRVSLLLKKFRFLLVCKKYSMQRII